MGQYYKIVIADDKNNVNATLDSWSMNFGAKLMEHSYYNLFVQSAVDYIKSHPHSRLIWAGDYADEIEGETDNFYYKTDNLYDEEGNIKDNSFLIPQALQQSEGYYICNDDKKLAFKYEDTTTPEESENYDWCVNPLPLLTCEGNGRGSGDYRRGTDFDYVGTWRGDHLSVHNEVPEGYELKTYKFKEG